VSKTPSRINLVDANHVWAAAYAAHFERELVEHVRLFPFPDEDRLLGMAEDAVTVADTATEAFCEHRRSCQRLEEAAKQNAHAKEKP
jgi:hypothetical protein